MPGSAREFLPLPLSSLACEAERRQQAGRAGHYRQCPGSAICLFIRSHRRPIVTPDDEERVPRSIALQNVTSMLVARQHAEQELIAAKEALEEKTRELADSLAMMRATLEATWHGILVTDERGNVMDFNEKAADMWRIPPAVMDSRRHHEILTFMGLYFEDPEKFLARVDEIYAASPAESFDVLELSDGRVFERYSRMESVAGKKVGRVWSFRDVRAPRRTEEVLREETRVLELLNRTGTALSSKLDLPSIVQAATDAATELSGAAFGAFFYKTADDESDALTFSARSGARREDVDGFLPPRAASFLGPILRGERAIRCDDVLTDARFERMRFDSSERPGYPAARSYLVVPVVVRPGDVIGGLLFGHPEAGIFNERAERLVVGVAAQAAIAIDNARLYQAAQTAAAERQRLLESEQYARGEAERASSMRDEFLATLSHELRTPLGAILGWSHMLRLPGVKDAERHHGLEVIERNARMQAQLIEDLLDMSRISAGKMRLDIQPVHPVSFIEAAIEAVRPAAEAKAIRLSKRLDPATVPIVGDPSRLQQVVWNLLSNAIKFTPNHGRVLIELQRVNSSVEITVEDTGIGIKPEFLPHVFDRFRQADSSATRTAGGLGLGLAIVKQLVELHGGTVGVSSPGENGGATFTVRLPWRAVYRDADARESPPLSRERASLPRIDLSGITVLVVDDQEDARDLLARVLAGCDAQVLAASTIGEGLAIVERERPDVLVSDIGMPDGDGYDLLRRVRALGQARGGKTPAIALTAFARSEDRTHALRAGFLVHLSKPIEPSELIATIASVVGRTGDPILE
jgi:signal transduction histidine kinase/ActR/RegA family two-component response regulator/PAS domain-containing protein